MLWTGLQQPLLARAQPLLELRRAVAACAKREGFKTRAPRSVQVVHTHKNFREHPSFKYQYSTVKTSSTVQEKEERKSLCTP